MYNQPEYYDREKLYAEVWAEPVTKVANRYGVSDVYIARVCRKMKIPVPGRGYWSKIASGQKLKQPPLRKFKDCPKIKRQLRKPEKIEEEKIDRLVPEAFVLQDQLIQKESEMKIKCIPDIKITNPFVKNTKRKLKETAKHISKTYGYGRCYSSNDESFEIQIGPDNIPRALAILQNLCNSLATRGYSIKTNPKKEKETREYNYGYYQYEIHPVYAVVLDTYIPFKITEKSIRHEIAKKDRNYSHERYEYEPSGKLCFELLSVPYGNNIRSRWQDGKKLKVEDNLQDIIINMIKYATMVKERKAQAAKQREIQKIEDAKRRELEKQKKIENTRVENLIKEAERLVKFKQIKDYIEVIIPVGEQRLGNAYPNSDFSKWVEWAEGIIEKNDPENWELPKYDIPDEFSFFRQGPV